MATAIELIMAERARQLETWPLAHDDTHDCDELARAAAIYALPRRIRLERVYGPLSGRPRELWKWLWPFYTPPKPSPDDRVRELVKAGALIVAEIERLQRCSSNDGE